MRWLSSMPFPTIMALAHAIGDKVEAAYRRGDLFEKRRRLMKTEPCSAWGATIILAGGTTNMMAGGEESKAA